MSENNAPVRRFEVELVDRASPTPKAPPPGLPEAGTAPDGEAQPRARDYLDGFLAARPAAPDGTAAEDDEALKAAIIATLQDIFDPEIPVNIYDLGLIYGIEINEGHVIVSMTLTTPHCPVAETMPGEVELRVLGVPGVATCDVNLVWDPPWNPGAMSDEARLELGML